jgi:hypothetical protein
VFSPLISLARKFGTVGRLEAVRRAGAEYSATAFLARSVVYRGDTDQSLRRDWVYVPEIPIIVRARQKSGDAAFASSNVSLTLHLDRDYQATYDFGDGLFPQPSEIGVKTIHPDKPTSAAFFGDDYAQLAPFAHSLFVCLPLTLPRMFVILSWRDEDALADPDVDARGPDREPDRLPYLWRFVPFGLLDQPPVVSL